MKLRLERREKATIVSIFTVISIATLIGSLASASIAGTSAALAGLVIVAFTFGLRHGMDADHIAAIDNITRKLINEGKRRSSRPSRSYKPQEQFWAQPCQGPSFGSSD